MIVITLILVTAAICCMAVAHSDAEQSPEFKHPASIDNETHYSEELRLNKHNSNVDLPIS